MLQRLGAQAVGMSTVPETILARRRPARAGLLARFTNMGCGLQAEALNFPRAPRWRGRRQRRVAVALLEAVITALPA